MAVIVLTRIPVLLAKRFNLPDFTIQLLIGILLGPSLSNLLEGPIILGTWGSPFSGPLHGILKILAEIGLIQLMFIAGLKTDWYELKKVAKLSFSVGALGFLLTAVNVAIITRVFVDRWSEALAVSAVMSASSFGISIYSLSERKRVDPKVVTIVSGAAILSGFLAILLMIASQATNYAMTFGPFKMMIAVSWFIGKLVMFFAVSYFLASRFLRLIAKTGSGKRPRQMLIGYLLLVAALYSWAALNFGSFAAVVVASLGGVLLGTTNMEVKNKTAGGFQSIWASIPISVLFIVIGMEVSFKAVGTTVVFLATLLGTAVIMKLIGSWIATSKEFGSSREQLFIMMGALPQGEMGVLIAAYLLSRGLLDPSSFNTAIISVVIVTMLTSILIKTASTEINVQEASVPVNHSSNPLLPKGK